MFKKILKISVIILIIGFISVFVKGYKYQEEKNNQEDNHIVESLSDEKQDLIDEEIITSLLDNKEEQEIIEEKGLEDTVQEINQEVVIPEESISQPKQEEQTSQEKKNEIISTIPETVVPQPKQPTEWEKLGISEYDYYNSPEIFWKTVDFDINKYGNKDAAATACYNAGANYTGLENYRFRCDETYSHSNKFLGYHIEYIELESE
ncbi:MAG: hypothetical protein HFH31_00560 [Bacilli bacterium]|nr:hypothetical protein [Bacilli bacterium]